MKKKQPKITIGVLALQGDFADHIKILKKCKVQTREIRLKEDLKNIDGLIIPGGESTTIGKLLSMYNLDSEIIKKAKKGMAVFGTCAGAILLSKEIIKNKQESLGLIDISTQRNAYGRQLESFETELDIKEIGKVKADFIRAPAIKRTGKKVKILAKCDKDPVLVRENNILAGTFHTELTNDLKVHKYFISMIKEKNSKL